MVCMITENDSINNDTKIFDHLVECNPLNEDKYERGIFSGSQTKVIISWLSHPLISLGCQNDAH